MIFEVILAADSEKKRVLTSVSEENRQTGKFLKIRFFFGVILVSKIDIKLYLRPRLFTRHCEKLIPN